MAVVLISASKSCQASNDSSIWDKMVVTGHHPPLTEQRSGLQPFIHPYSLGSEGSTMEIIPGVGSSLAI